MEEVKERVSELEAVLGRFIVHTESLFKRMEKDTATFREEVRHDQQHQDESMKVFREEIRHDQQHQDESMKVFREEIRHDQQQRDGEIKAFREEVRHDQQQRDEDMKAFQQGMHRTIESLNKHMNERWGELANRWGTIVEDIVAPNLPTIAERYFGCTTIDTFALRVEKKNQVQKGTLKNAKQDFDAILVC